MNVQSIISKQTTGRRACLAGGAMLLALAASASSHAAIVVHLNPAGPGHFDWSPELNGPAVHLDITQPADLQPNRNAFSISQELFDGFSMISGGALTMTGGSDGLFVLDIPEGTTIGPATPWVDTTGWIQMGTESEIAEGTQTYLAFQFNPGDGTHYGWVGVVRSGFELDAFAWGYETEIGVAIAAGAGIPAPGALSLLALAGVTGRRRRRA